MYRFGRFFDDLKLRVYGFPRPTEQISFSGLNNRRRDVVRAYPLNTLQSALQVRRNTDTHADTQAPCNLFTRRPSASECNYYTKYYVYSCTRVLSYSPPAGRGPNTATTDMLQYPLQFSLETQTRPCIF